VESLVPTSTVCRVWLRSPDNQVAWQKCREESRRRKQKMGYHPAPNCGLDIRKDGWVQLWGFNVPQLDWSRDSASVVAMLQAAYQDWMPYGRVSFVWIKAGLNALGAKVPEDGEKR